MNAWSPSPAPPRRGAGTTPCSWREGEGGALVPLQLRRAASLRTLLAKADLLHGFDLARRDAARLGLWLARVRGRRRVAADSSLGPEQVRARLGALAAEAFEVAEFGIGQVRRAGVHLFGLTARGSSTRAREPGPAWRSGRRPPRLARWSSSMPPIR